MPHTQAIKSEHIKAIVNTGNIIAMLNKAGLGNDKATEIAQEIDVQINAVLDDKLDYEEVIKIVEEHLEGVATKEFVRAEIQKVRAEIQEVRAEIQEVRAELKADIQEVRADLNEFKIEVRSEFKVVRSEMKEMKAELKTDIYKTSRQNIMTIIACMSVFLGFLYFLLNHHI